MTKPIKGYCRCHVVCCGKTYKDEHIASCAPTLCSQPTKKVELCKHQAIHCSQCSTLPKEPEGLIDFEFCERFSDELDAINYFAIKSFIQNLLAQQAAETRLATIEECIESLNAKGGMSYYTMIKSLESLKEQTN